MIRLSHLLAFSVAIILSSCGFDCIDKKTGLHRSSLTLSDSKRNGVYKFEMGSNKLKFRLDNGRVFTLKHAWVENAWSYECVGNKAILKKEPYLQFVIDGDYNGSANGLTYLLQSSESFGNYLGGPLSFGYSGGDSVELLLRNEITKAVIDTLSFEKLRGE